MTPVALSNKVTLWTPVRSFDDGNLNAGKLSPGVTVSDTQEFYSDSGWVTCSRMHIRKGNSILTILNLF